MIIVFLSGMAIYAEVSHESSFVDHTDMIVKRIV